MKALKVCNIFCSEIDDFDILKDYLKKYPVYISLDPSVIEDKDPTLILGWSYVKERNPNQNILDREIKNSKNGWCFSGKEDKKKLINCVTEFVNENLIKWLPDDHILYDPVFDGGIVEYFDNNINIQKNTFVYYSNGAIYMHNDNKNYIFNIKTLLYGSLIYKKEITKILNKDNVFCFSYNNVKEVSCIDDLKNFTFESVFWVKYGIEIDEDKQFNIIPNFSYKKHIPFFMSWMGIPDFDEEDLEFANRMVVRDKVTTYCSTREIAILEGEEIKGKKIKQKKGHGLVSINFSNKRTITNRIVVKDSWNIQNEKKHSERRGFIKSRFKGGKILVCDYQSFETWISIFMTRDLGFINYFKGKDVHREVAKALYQKDIIKNEERSFAKVLNHSMLYGASYNRLIKTISEKGLDNPEERLYYVQKLLKPIVENSIKINKRVEEEGYAKTSWGSIVKPNKSHAAYNNLIQTTASEILVDKIEDIRNLFKSKNSCFLFQIHDSLIFDIDIKDKNIFIDIMKILTNFRGQKFPITYSFGENYLELSEEKVF